MTSNCCTIVDRKVHVQYLQFQRAIPDDCTSSLTEQNIAIHDHNDAMITFLRTYLQSIIGFQIYVLSYGAISSRPLNYLLCFRDVPELTL